MSSRSAPLIPEPSRWTRLALAGVLSIGAGASLALNWPGQFSPDAVSQLSQGRSGLFNTWHPPVMAWILGIMDRLTPEAGGFILLQVTLCFGGLYALAALPRRPAPWVIPLAALMLASPLLLIYQGEVWKDVLFADSALAGFAFLAWAGRCWDDPLRRYGLIIMALGLLSLAGLVRQNGVIASVWGCVALAILAGHQPSRSLSMRLARAAGHGLAAAVLALGLMAVVDAALLSHSDGEPAQAEQINLLQAWDLAGAIRIDPRFRLTRLGRSDPDAARWLGAVGAPAWTPQRVDPLAMALGGASVLDDAQPGLADQWSLLVRQHPMLYARIRLAAFGELLCTPTAQRCRPLFIGVAGSAAERRAAGLALRHRAQDRWLRDYGLGPGVQPVYDHGAYGSLAAVLLVWAAIDYRRGRAPREMIVVACLLVSALGFTLSFLLIGLACDYRYLYFLDLAAMAALLHRVASLNQAPFDGR